MILISQDGETIVHFEAVTLSIQEDGSIFQIAAYPYANLSDGYVMGEYYSKDEALRQFELVIDASQFARRFRFAK